MVKIFTTEAVPGYVDFAADLAAISNMGYSFYMHAGMAGSTFLNMTYPKAWISHYSDGGLFFVDPTVIWAVLNNGTARWSEIERQATRGRHQLLHRAADFGLRYGGAASGLNSTKRRCALFVARSDRELSDGELQRLDEILAVTMHSFETHFVFSEDDIQTIRLLAEGKSQEEIAHENRISRDAVKKRVEKIRRRIGARNTTHIVSLAMRHNLLI